jgi:hypothetical protein
MALPKCLAFLQVPPGWWCGANASAPGSNGFRVGVYFGCKSTAFSDFAGPEAEPRDVGAGVCEARSSAATAAARQGKLSLDSTALRASANAAP